MNPMYQKANRLTMDDFKRKLRDKEFIAQMEIKARQQGISEKDIMQGKAMLYQLLE